MIVKYGGLWRLSFVVQDQEVDYYIDGDLYATHGGANYPVSLMSICFNLWFSTVSDAQTARDWVEDIDWVVHVKDIALDRDEVEDLVTTLRDEGIVRVDNVPD